MMDQSADCRERERPDMANANAKRVRRRRNVGAELAATIRRLQAEHDRADDV